MKKIFILGLMALLCHFASAQHKLSGSVITGNSQPLPGVTIYIQEINKGTISDANGYYQLNNLPEGELKSRLEGLLSRIGFASKGLSVMDASKRSAKGNAYMTGFGKNKRIVLFDTLLSKMTPEETEAVLAHELGHYKLHHIYKMMAFSFIFSLLFFWILSVLAECSWFYEGLGVNLSHGASHGVALILFSVAVPLFLFPLAPLTSLFSRKHEFEADAFAVRYSSGSALISALVKLFSDNAATLTPDPLYSAFYSSHPDAAIRIATIQKEMSK